MFQNYLPYNIGIPSNSMNEVYAPQEKTQWCWAACVQMVMNAYGINVYQRELARKVCGEDFFGPYNCPASNSDISNSLNLKVNDENGNYWTVKAPLIIDPINLHELYIEIMNKKPVIIAYQKPDMNLGHAVIITGMECVTIGSMIYINKIIIRDPADNWLNRFNKGRKVISGPKDITNFINSIYAHWFIEVRKSVVYRPQNYYQRLYSY